MSGGIESVGKKDEMKRIEKEGEKRGGRKRKQRELATGIKTQREGECEREEK